MYRIQPLMLENEVVPNYEIDSNGVVYRLSKDNERKPVVPVTMANRYLFVNISHNHKSKLVSLAKLVLYNFSDIPTQIVKACQITYIDGDSTNVSVKNLTLKHRIDGALIRQPRLIQNVETKEISTISKLANQLNLEVAMISNYITHGRKIKGSLWKDYYDDIIDKDTTI